MFYLIFILNGLVARLLTSQDTITTIKPLFEKTVTEATFNKTLIHFQVINNYIHEITYQLYISQFNTKLWNSNITTYRNWEITNEDYFSIFRNTDAFWSTWSLAYTGKQRIIELISLNTSMSCII
jgi:hypothetical protein